MDGQMSPAKLTRTQSSLLRSSPTIRSSIHSLSSVAEEDLIAAQNDDVEAQKRRNHNPHFKPPVRPGPTRFSLLLLLALLSLLTLLFLLRRDELSSSETLLSALIFIAMGLFLASKNKSLIRRSLAAVRHTTIWRRGGGGGSPGKVQWFIGEARPCSSGSSKRIIRDGVELYSNGDFYEGEFHKGRCNGSGVYNFFVSGRYEGDWIDGHYDGYGIESWARGSRYKGQYRHGLRHGLGVYRFFTGDSYAGEWCNGQSHGVGVQTCADGSCFVGQFKCGVKHGLGCYHFRNGDSYTGEYFGDKIHGFGVYHFGNGHCYEGSWHEGRKQGYGMYTFRSGDAKSGEWDGGSLKHPSPPLNESVLRAVQAARKTAESAIKLRRVDEDVNKAVVAANRAATAARVAAVKAVQNRLDGNFCVTNV